MGKYFISTDIEGVADICSWDETNKKHSDYSPFQNIMTSEVASICEAFDITDEIMVRDAHWSARNIIHERLPQNTKLIRAFNGHPLSMMFGLDKSYDFSILHGYHAMAGSGLSPLAHTMSHTKLYEIKLNGKSIGETTISILNSNYYNVPMCYIIGDKGAVEEAQSLNKNIIGTITKYGVGASIVSEHPIVIQNKIKEDLKLVQENFAKSPKACIVDIPKEFVVEISYKEQEMAYRFSFYPGAELKSPTSIKFKTTDFVEFIRMVEFCS